MRFSPDAPIQIGGCGCCTGPRESVASRTWQCSPSNVNAVGREQAAHDLHRLLERVDALLQRGERDAERAVLLVEPRRAVGELEPAARRVVDRDRLGREDRRVAVGHAGDEQAEPDRVVVIPLSAASVVMPSKHSPGPSPYMGWKWSKPQMPSKPSVVGEARPRDDLGPGHALLRDVEPETASRRERMSRSVRRPWRRAPGARR